MTAKEFFNMLDEIKADEMLKKMTVGEFAAWLRQKENARIVIRYSRVKEECIRIGVNPFMECI